MLRYRHLCLVTLGVADIARSRAFYENLPGLWPVQEAVDGTVRFRVGDDRAFLELSGAASPGLKRFGFEMESAAAMEELVRVIDREGVKWTHVANGVRMVEPHTGAAVEFHCGVSDVRFPSGTLAIEGLGHIVLRTPAYREAVAFWREVLGFRLSDEIDGRISLLRCFPNPLHHSLGIASGERRMFHHLNFRVREGTDLEAARQGLAGAGIAIASGPGVHAPSGSGFLYFYDPDGLTLEMATATERFVEGDERPPRILPDRAESFAVGNVRRDPRMYTVGEIEKAEAESG